MEQLTELAGELAQWLKDSVLTGLEQPVEGSVATVVAALATEVAAVVVLELVVAEPAASVEAPLEVAAVVVAAAMAAEEAVVQPRAPAPGEAVED
jgi:hypothetical protein